MDLPSSLHCISSVCVWFLMLTSIVLHASVSLQGPSLAKQPLCMCAVSGQPGRVLQAPCCSFGETRTEQCSLCESTLFKRQCVLSHLCRKTCKASQKQVCIPFRMKRPFPGAATANISQRRRSGQYSERCVHECTWVQVHLTLTQQLLSVLCSFYNYNTGHKQEVRTDDCISWSTIKRLPCSRDKLCTKYLAI